jgi:hypothetical protein
LKVQPKERRPCGTKARATSYPQAAFQKLIATLRGLDYNILDVKITRWHDDFNAFKGAVKDLEVLMQNVINLAFESAGSLAASVETLDAFQTLAKRDAIVKCVERKTSEVSCRGGGGVDKNFLYSWR